MTALERTGMRYTEWERVYRRGVPFLQRFPADAPGDMSFKVVREVWEAEPGPSDHNPEGIPERTVMEWEPSS